MLITQGAYEQNEKDIGFIQAGGFYITRKYRSDSKVTSSFGYGWSTTLDERIILGVQPGFDILEQKLSAYAQRLNESIF